MATRKRHSTIKNRNESISSRKKRNRANPLQAELDKPLAKSFKQGAAVGATLAGPGKLKKAFKAAKDVTKRFAKAGAKAIKGEAAAVKNAAIQAKAVTKRFAKAGRKAKKRK